MPVDLRLAFVAAAFVLLMIPGPTVLAVLSHAPSQRRRGALTTPAAGVALGGMGVGHRNPAARLSAGGLRRAIAVLGPGRATARSGTMPKLPPRDQAPRVLAVLTVRNEGVFLIDWLAHHRACGVSDFLVFSNDCQDGSDRMLDRLAALGWLAHVRNDGPYGGAGVQWAALKRADRHPLRAAADWVVALDIDEYINVHVGDRSLGALIGALPAATAITLTWRLFGNGGVMSDAGLPVTETFTAAAPAVMGWPWRAGMFKTLFRDDGGYDRLGIHRPRQPDPARIADQRWFDGSGRELPGLFHRQRVFSILGQDNYRLAQINHYPLGSMEGFLLKCDRGRANRAADRLGLDYWVERNFCDVEDRSILAMAPASAPLRDALRADPELGALHRAAARWRRARFDALMRDEDQRGLLGRLMMAPASRVPGPEEQRFLIALAQRDARLGGAETEPGRAPD